MTIVNYVITIVTITTVYLVIPVYGIITKSYWMCSTWLLPILSLVMVLVMGNSHVKIAWRKTIQTIRSIVH